MLLPCVVLVSIAIATASDVGAVGGDVRAFALAVDISAPTTVNTFSCYRQSQFLTAFIRIYIPTGSGQIDTESPNTVRNAFTGELIRNDECICVDYSRTRRRSLCNAAAEWR